jgi:uncharacterized membrane protein YoaK (UPF0700 family)
MTGQEWNVKQESADEQTGVRFRSRKSALRVVPLKPTARPELGHELGWSTALSGVAGYVDTAGFLALFGLYTAHVTGDLVTTGAAIVEPRAPGLAVRVAMIPVFVLTVAATTLAVRSLRSRKIAPLAPLLGVMTLALAAFGLAGASLRLGPFNASSLLVVGGLGVAAMGIQNTLMRDMLSGLCPTTFMTGNITQLAMDLVEVVVPAGAPGPEQRASQRAEALRRLRRFGAPLAGFVVGTCLGAYLTAVYGLGAVVLPAAVTGGLGCSAWRRARTGSSARSAQGSASAGDGPRGVHRNAVARA